MARQLGVLGKLASWKYSQKSSVLTFALAFFSTGRSDLPWICAGMGAPARSRKVGAMSILAARAYIFVPGLRSFG